METVGSGINFNWIEFTRTATYSSSQTPPEPTTIHKDLLASALGSWNGIPAELQQPRMTFVEDDGKRYPAVTFLIRLGGWKTENGYVTNELCYEPVCSETVHTWDEPLVRVNNPPGLPVPPAGFKFATFRFDNNAPDKAFFRVNVYAKNVDPTASDF